jgi:enoyl-CoA hydratase
VTGAGGAFCAGADLDVLASGDPESYARIYEGFLRVARCPLPTVAAIDGAATGAGVNLALCCDVRLVSPRARIVARFLDLGLHPGGGHTWMLNRVVGPQHARAMVLFGEEARGAEAVTMGLALRCVASEDLVSAACEFAGRAASLPRPVAQRAKQTLEAVTGIDRHAEAIALESEAQQWSVTQGFFRERLAALRERVGGRK